MMRIFIVAIILILSSTVIFATDLQFSSIQDIRHRIEYSREIKKGALGEEKEGLFYIDLNGDGKKDVIVTGHRENGNAHDFYVHSFYIVTPASLEIIEIQEKESDDKHSEFCLYTSPFDREHIVSDFRLIKMKGAKELFLFKAYRKISTAYTDPSDTFYDIYKLKYDDDSNRYLFIKMNTFKTKGRYSNAVEAFKELGIQ